MDSPHRLPSLLLLPSPPRPISKATLRVAYKLPVTAVLVHLSDEHKKACLSSSQPPGLSSAYPPTPILIVAIASRILLGSLSGPLCGTVNWSPAQMLLAGIYSLIASVCAEHGIAIDVDGRDPGTVDVRIILIDHALGWTLSWYQEHTQAQLPRGHRYQPCSTSVLDLAAFSATLGPWNIVYYPSCERGYKLVATYLELSANRGRKILQDQIVAVQGGLSFCLLRQVEDGQIKPLGTTSTSLVAPELSPELAAVGGYHTICLGGTFDHLHLGHKLLLHAAALLLRVPVADDDNTRAVPCVLIVGISGDELIARKQYAEEMQSWDVRARSVLAFIATILGLGHTMAEVNALGKAYEQGYNSYMPVEDSAVTMLEREKPSSTRELRVSFSRGAILVRCIDIRDPFGPTISEEDIDAIVVSGETRSGAAAINELRVLRGWRPLQIYEIDVLDISDNYSEDDDQQADGGPREAQGDIRERYITKLSSTEIRRQKAVARSP